MKAQDLAVIHEEQIHRNYVSFVIVRARECDEDTEKLCTELMGLFVSKKIDVTEDSIEKVNISQDSDKLYILIGNTSLQLSKTNQQRVENGCASFLLEGNCLSVCASDSRLLWMAVEQMMRSCLKDGKFSLLKKYLNTKIDYSSRSRDGWTFKLPCYVGGELDARVYSCGYGFVFKEGSLSYMQSINETSAQEFEAWKRTLSEYGYREVFSNSIENHQYVSYEDAFGTLYYAYYLSDLKKVRIVCDSESIPLDEFCYALESGSNHPQFYMFKDNDVNYGDSFLIHASDDSWIVIDGQTGDDQYAKDDSIGDQLFEFMSRRSEMSDGKLVISAWYVSHAHTDHTTGFRSLIRRHAKDIDLQRVMLNIPDPDIGRITGLKKLYNDRQNGLFNDVAKLINSEYPDVKILKVHTGMKIQLADIRFTVLFTQEDLLEQWYSGTAQDVNNWNFSSVVSMLEMDEMRILLMADNFRPDLTLKRYSMEDTLACDIYKVGHHYIDRQAGVLEFHENFHKTCGFKYALITMSYFYKAMNDHAYLQDLGEDIFTITRTDEVIGFFSNGNGIERHYYAE